MRDLLCAVTAYKKGEYFWDVFPNRWMRVALLAFQGDVDRIWNLLGSSSSAP
jgi:hypothetical protein